LGNLTGLLAKIKPAIEATTYAGERWAKSYAFVDAVARKNVEMTVAGIPQDSPVLAELEAKGAIKMTGGMYNLETGAWNFSTEAPEIRLLSGPVASPHNQNGRAASIARATHDSPRRRWG
jgi:carbonic anhydrase